MGKRVLGTGCIYKRWRYRAEQHDAFDKLQGAGCTYTWGTYRFREKTREVGRNLILKALFDRLKSLNFVLNYENSSRIFFFLRSLFSNLGSRLGNRLESGSPV